MESISSIDRDLSPEEMDIMQKAQIQIIIINIYLLLLFILITKVNIVWEIKVKLMWI